MVCVGAIIKSGMPSSYFDQHRYEAPPPPLLCILLLVVFSTAEGPDYAYCGDCHCIVVNDGDDNDEPSCPAEAPPTEFRADYVAFLQSLQVTNPYELSCNPYQDDACETTPPQSNLTALGDAAACGVVYDLVEGPSGDDDDDQHECPTRYRLVSYASVEELEKDGAVLTHHGACGVCSTTQDLAVYIENPDLVAKGTECSLQGLLDFERGVRCYQQVGYTEVRAGCVRECVIWPICDVLSLLALLLTTQTTTVLCSRAPPCGSTMAFTPGTTAWEPACDSTSKTCPTTDHLPRAPLPNVCSAMKWRAGPCFKRWRRDRGADRGS